MAQSAQPEKGTQMPDTKRILLIIGGGIAAYKSLELIRLIKKAGLNVRVVLTEAAKHFVTPMTAAALSGDTVYDTLFDLTVEAEMGHIMLSRQADLMAKAANGLANDLASTLLLATDKPVLMAPAMNVRMWQHAATQRNLDTLRGDGILFTGPDDGDMACGEYGLGRMSEPEAIFAAIENHLNPHKPLLGKTIVVTAGPTFEALDPVRGLTNRSSGRQGFAIAEKLARDGAAVTLIAGPVALATPASVTRIDVESALEMFDAAHAHLQCDAFVAVAAVADWRPREIAGEKQKKTPGVDEVSVTFVKNPDILEAVSKHLDHRPRLVVGFAAETQKIEDYAQAKLASKGCDAIVANDVTSGVFGTARNSATLVDLDGLTPIPGDTKTAVADFLSTYIQKRLA